jgi:hypothetical protein
MIYVTYLSFSSFIENRDERVRYNRAIKEINNCNYEKGEKLLREFLHSDDSYVSSSASKELVKLYKFLGSRSTNTIDESAVYYMKARRIDPDCLEQKQIDLLEKYMERNR